MSTATDVSIKPRCSVNPVARRRVLIDVTVDVDSKLLVVDTRGVLEGSDELLRRHELASPVRAELTDRLAVPRHDEVLPRVQRPHHLAAVVAQLSLGQFPRHPRHRSTRAPLKFGFAKELRASAQANL